MNNVDREGLLKLFVAGLPDAVVLLDVGGTVLTWNAGAQDITGYSAAEMLGRNFSRLYTPGDIVADQPSLALTRALAEGRHEETTQCLRRDGTQRRVRNVLMPIYDSRRLLGGFGYTMHDASGAIEVASAAVVAGALPALQPCETILVVDDDQHLRESVSEQLTGLGYRAVVASSGPEALEVMAREPHIDLLLTDVVMPGGMNGREVAEEARLIDPKLKVLFTSGYFEGALHRNGELATNAQVLCKPYRKKELAQRVQEALKSTAA
jgi:PAS domain S-box-containing protein